MYALLFGLLVASEIQLIEYMPSYTFESKDLCEETIVELQPIYAEALREENLVLLCVPLSNLYYEQ